MMKKILLFLCLLSLAALAGCAGTTTFSDFQVEEADTALAVGRIWAAVGAGLGALQNFIRIRPGQITVQPDYTGDEERKASFSCKITGCLFIMVSVGIWAFRRLKEQKFL